MVYESTAIPREVSYNVVSCIDDDVSSIRSTSTSSSFSSGESSTSEEEDHHEHHHIYALPSVDAITQRLPMFRSEMKALRAQRKQTNRHHRNDYGGGSTTANMMYTQRIAEPSLPSSCPSDEESIPFIENVGSQRFGNEVNSSLLWDNTDEWKFDVDDETGGLFRHSLPSREIDEESISSQQKSRLLQATQREGHNEFNEESREENDVSFLAPPTESPLAHANEQSEWIDLDFNSLRHPREHEHISENMSTMTRNSTDPWFSEPAASSSSSRRRPTKLRQRTMSLNSRIEMWQHHLGKPFRLISRIKFPPSSGHLGNDCFGRGILESVLPQTNGGSAKDDTRTDNEEETIFFYERTTKNATMEDLEWGDLCSTSESTVAARDNAPIWRQEVVCGSPKSNLLLSTGGTRHALNSRSTKKDSYGLYVNGGNEEGGIDWEALTMITTQSTQESYDDERINLVTYKGHY